MLTLASLFVGCEIHPHGYHTRPHVVAAPSAPEYVVVETNTHLYDFINDYGEYCYAEWDVHGHGNCVVEYCLDDYSFSPNGWYHWDYYCI